MNHIEAMKLALDALELIQTDIEWQLNSPTRKFCRKAEISIRQAIEQAEDAVAAEREACAKLCENVVSNLGWVQSKWCAEEIRKRT